MAKKKAEGTSVLMSGAEDSYMLEQVKKQSNLESVEVKKESKQAEDKTQLYTLNPPYSFSVLSLLYELNTYHSRCCQLKASCTCLTGFKLVTDDDKKDQDSDYKAIMAWIDDHANYTAEKYNGQDFLTTLYNFCLDREIFSNAFFEIARNGKNDVAQVFHIPAKECQLQRSKGKIELKQQIGADVTRFDKFNSSDRNKERNEFLHLKNYSPKSRYYGVPEYIASLAAMALDRSATEYNIRNFENNLMISAIITLIGGALDKTTKKNIRDFLTNNAKGVANSGKVLLLELEEGSKDQVELQIEKVSSDLRDSSYRNLRADNKEEVVAAHGVPPRLVGIMTASQLGGTGEYQQQLSMFRDLVIKPRQKQLEFLINNYILKSAFPKNKKWRFEFNAFDISDAVADSEYYSNLMNIIDEEGRKVLDSDEIREQIGFAPRQDKTDPDKTKKKKIDAGTKLVEGLTELKKALMEIQN